jgi:hypothetical protein
MRGFRVMVSLGILTGLQLADRQALAGAEDTEGLRRFALIASSNEGGAGRVPLRFADSDARAVADVLTHLGGLRGQDLVLLPGARRATFVASFERLRAAIGRMAGEPGRRELFIYYSGHSDEQGLLLGGERVSYAELRQWINGTDADVRIGILDSCASGALIRLRGGTRRPPFLRDASADARGHAFLTASSADEAAQESDRIGAAFFTHYLVSGLRGAADITRDGLVTLAEAYQFAYHETLRHTARTSAGAQHPAYDMQMSGIGDLVLTDLRSSSASLILDERLSGRIFVRDGSGRLLVELRKQPMAAVKLGLPAGRYEVYLEQDRRGYQAAATLRNGATTTLASSHFAIAEVDPAIARGAAAPSNTLVGDPMFQRKHRFPAYIGLGFGQMRVFQQDGFLVSRLEAAALLFGRRLALGLITGGGLSGGLSEQATSVNLNQVAAVARYSFLCERHAYCFSLGLASGFVGVEHKDEATGEEMEEDALFLLEPSATWYVNVTHFLRLSVDAGYRFVAGGKEVSPSDVRGFTLAFTTQFGWF